MLPKKELRTFIEHGQERTDPYYWLNDKNNPEVIQYLESQNEYTSLQMQHTEGLQQRLFEEMKSRIKEEDTSVPVYWKGYYYYHRTEAGKQYAIHCRKEENLSGPEEIVLDENQLAEGKEYFQLGNFAVSPDHQWLAYSTDTDGSEQYTIFVKNLQTFELAGEQIPNTYYSLEWDANSQTFFYVVLDEALRPFQVYRHRLGEKNDELVFHEKDEMYFVELTKSKTEDYVFIKTASKLTSEVLYLDANTPDKDFSVFRPRKEGIEYHVEHHKERFYIRTNENAKNFKLMAAPLEGCKDPDTWQEVIAHRPEVKLESLEVFDQYLAVFERSEGLRKIRVENLDTSHVDYVQFPEETYMIYESETPDYYSPSLRFQYTSLVRPKTVYQYIMGIQEQIVMKETEVEGGYNPAYYVSKRLFAEAVDGTLVPMSMVYRKGIEHNGNNPLFLYGYGSYGITTDATFSSNRLSLLNRGVIFVIAHIRGGGDMGEEWYEDGKFLKKKNTFTDFIACAEYLIAEKYTNPDKLAISGGSAGGLLMGAVINMRPDLFKAVVAKVPFVDVVNTMMDPTLPLTITEYEEWGNPNDKNFYEYIQSYSPYDNVEEKDYPHILATAGLNDPRVGYWEPAKWVAKLRERKTDQNKLLLKTHMGAGHGGASGRFDYLKEIAFDYAFIMDVLEV